MANKENITLPEEKKKSKELQKKEEIKEAQDKVRQSSEEIQEEMKLKEKVPLPEMAKDDLSGLSEEAKGILKRNKNISEKKVENEEEKESKSSEKKISLEETVENDHHLEQGHNISYGQEKFSGYIQELSQEPVYKIKQEMQSMYDSLQEKGYMNAEEQQRARNRLEAMEEKMLAIDRGIYSMSEEAAEEASLIKKIGSSLLHNSYKRHSNSQYQN